jgi:hypothetical protein
MRPSIEKMTGRRPVEPLDFEHAAIDFFDMRAPAVSIYPICGAGRPTAVERTTASAR